MGWEQRGTKSTTTAKSARVRGSNRSMLGRGEMAHMISQFESSSTELEKLMRAKRSIDGHELERVEVVLDQAVELAQLFTQATLLTVGFHTHHRQWRRKRNVR